MGISGNYTRVDDETLAVLRSLPRAELEDEVFGPSEVEDVVEFDIGTSWDGVHFLLTGVSARHPIAGNLLSEAVLGTTRVALEPTAAISFTTRERLREIETAWATFAPQHRTVAEVRAHRIYPIADWDTDGIDQALTLFAARARKLFEFISATVQSGENLVVEIR